MREYLMRQSARQAFSVLFITLALAACDREAGQELTLSTHCGIDELKFQGQWYERVGGPLDDGSGNPPAGWDNPEQEGTVTRVDEATLLFTDEVGHREEFVLREGATGPKRSCE